MQLAFERCPSASCTRPELGHLKKANRRRIAISSSSGRDRDPGEAVTVEAFEPGEKVKVSGISIGKGFATIKRHSFHRGPDRTDRTTSGPGLDRRSARPLARVQGPQDGRPAGRQAPDPGRADVHEVDVERNLLLIKGAVPGPKNGIVEVREDKGRGRSKAPVLDVTGKKSSRPHARGVGVRRRAEAAASSTRPCARS